MADKTTGRLDVSGWNRSLKALSGPLRTKLARSMAVAGGEVLRDEAKARAPVLDGVLKAAIYLAFRDGKSNEREVRYSVTWNSKRAPHGHLLEFGYWQIYRILKLPGGRFVTDLSTRLPSPKHVAAKPFLRPAFEAAADRAMKSMLARGRVRLPELLAEAKS